MKAKSGMVLYLILHGNSCKEKRAGVQEVEVSQEPSLLWFQCVL